MKKKLKTTESDNVTATFNPSQKKDNSPIIPQRSKFKGTLSIFNRELTVKQHEFLKLANHKNTKIIFVSGPAGSSKTYLSVLHALNMLNDKKISDIIYIRSAVESSDSKLGFLPGEITDKMSPYLQPLLDKISELLPQHQISTLEKEQRFSSIPVGFLRGLNFNAKAIIADEAQNMSYKELFTLITRTGEFSKVFILGDPDQSDINGRSGFVKMVNMFSDDDSRNAGIHVFNFTDDDIVRSGLVKFIIQKSRINS